MCITLRIQPVFLLLPRHHPIRWGVTSFVLLCLAGTFVLPLLTQLLCQSTMLQLPYFIFGKWSVIETSYIWGVIVSDPSRVQTIESVTWNKAEEAKNARVSQRSYFLLKSRMGFQTAFRFKTITCLVPDFLHCNISLLVVLVLHWASFIYIYFISLVLFLSHASYL